MHHKSIVLKTALASSPFEFSLITQLSAEKHMDISTPGGWTTQEPLFNYQKAQR